MDNGQPDDGNESKDMMNDDELGAELRGLTPAPQADYWDKIDAAIGAAAAEVEDEAARERSDSLDTDAEVVRLTDMTTTIPNNSNSNTALLALAAAIVLIAGVGAYALFGRSGSDTVDVADNTQPVPVTEPGEVDPPSTPPPPDTPPPALTQVPPPTTTEADVGDTVPPTIAQPDGPVPPTTAPPTTNPASAPGSYPIFANGIHIGGWSDGEWTSPKGADAGDLDGLAVRNAQDQESTPGSAISSGLCSVDSEVLFYLDLGTGFEGISIASPTWDLVPRTVSEIAPQAIHDDVVRNVLADAGLIDPNLSNLQAFQGDFDGDGTNEVILQASNGEPTLYGSRAGDFSVLLLRSFDEETETVINDVLRVEVVTGDEERFENPEAPEDVIVGSYVESATFESAVDLNGDGSLELIIDYSEYESGGTKVFDLTRSTTQSVLSMFCAA